MIRSQETRLLSDSKLTKAILLNPPYTVTVIGQSVPGVTMGTAEARAALIRITKENH